jgi:hypothetical protein
VRADAPVPSFVIVAFASVTTAPVESVTVPVIPALAWAQASLGRASTKHVMANASADAIHENLIALRRRQLSWGRCVSFTVSP